MTDTIKITSIQFKRGKKATLEAQLVGKNRLKEGEPAYETDTITNGIAKIKIGDGIHDYKKLPYISVSTDELNHIADGIVTDFSTIANRKANEMRRAVGDAQTAADRAEEAAQAVNDIPARVQEWINNKFQYITIEEYNNLPDGPDPETFYFIRP